MVFSEYSERVDFFYIYLWEYLMIIYKKWTFLFDFLQKRTIFSYIQKAESINETRHNKQY